MGKRKSRKRRPPYDPAESLRPTTLDSELEPIARDLYEKVCCGSKKHWPEIKSRSEFKTDQALRENFLSSAHEGMRAAQNHIVQRVESTAGLSFSEELLYRSIADTIAWQFLGEQLCHARRLFRGHNQPDLSQSNFSSVVSAANSIVESNPDSMPLLSDLTSFVQVGDILSLDPRSGLSIIEVKEGKVNQRISQFLKFYNESGCDRALHYFMSEEGPHTAKQMQRMIRQSGRMAHVSEMMSSGTSIDPDSGQKVYIPDEFIPISDWNEELSALLARSEEKGWALDVIEDCLFVGCYADTPMFHGSHIAFNLWFDECGGDAESPRAQMMDSIRSPLALPVFSRHIPVENKFDFLFGRKHLCMALSVEKLIEKCEEAGLIVRQGTNKETSKMEQAGAKPYRHKGKSIFIGDGSKELVLMDGIFMRVFFHGQKPVSTIRAILAAGLPT
ncbi:hypothetical protein HLB35_15535 [Halomonas sp. TBZ9]|uniref:Uncharacterized protein n=1 Tax=Vreelandella azerica TaxID=2732867 RepID=A0A7Y3TZ96_9GAMM|nr:hypothetical protein [Halomonas azerica]NOG32814.1 hypothetical protein [Halomonas azerica]